MAETTWARWHNSYADADSDLSHRLTHVRRRLDEALHGAPPGPITLISLCAGEGRDILGVLPTHPRRDDVTARLVELDPSIAAVARATASDEGLDDVDVVTGDAALVSAYDGFIPADIVIACGIFGNIDDAAIHATINGLTQLTRPGAIVLWTRHRREPDLTPSIRSWFDDAGFDEVGFDSEPGRLFSVGTHRFNGATAPLDPEAKLFEFVPHKR